jgi:hypothetical protein
MLPDDAERDAIEVLQESMSLYDDRWPEVPAPVIAECSRDGIDGVRFTYIVTIDAPRDPREFQHALREHWARRGYEVIPAQAEGDSNSVGTIYNAVIRKENAARVAFSASNAQLGLYVESQCAAGVPDDFRPVIE